MLPATKKSITNLLDFLNLRTYTCFNLKLEVKSYQLLTQLSHKFVCIDKNPYGDCKYSYLSSKINLCIVFTRSKSILPFFNIHCPLFFKWSHFTKAFLYISRLCKHNLVLFSCLPNLRADNCENAALGKQ